MIYTKQDMVSAFEKGWHSVNDYDTLETALEDFVGKMEADEAEFEAEVEDDRPENHWNFDRDSAAMEDWRLRKDSK